MKTKNIILLLLTILCSGCMGTITSRVQPEQIEHGKVVKGMTVNFFQSKHNFIGEYPYQAMYMNYHYMNLKGGPPNERQVVFIISLLSFPLDFVFDTVLLIPDLIAWPFGLQKFDLKKAEEEQKKREEKRKNKHNKKNPE